MTPIIAFTEESAGAVECATWLGSNLVDGSLVDDVFADVPGAVLVVSRLSHSIALTLAKGPMVFGAAQDLVSESWHDLGAALGISTDAENGKFGAIGDGEFLKKLLIALAKLLAEQLI